MKVSELIEKLQVMPQNKEVLVYSESLDIEYESIADVENDVPGEVIILF
jgi:hypothetical protein